MTNVSHRLPTTLPLTGDPIRTGARRSDVRSALVFIGPAAVGFLVFYVWPLIRGIYVSFTNYNICLLYTSPSPRDGLLSRMPSSA